MEKQEENLQNLGCSYKNLFDHASEAQRKDYHIQEISFAKYNEMIGDWQTHGHLFNPEFAEGHFVVEVPTGKLYLDPLADKKFYAMSGDEDLTYLAVHTHDGEFRTCLECTWQEEAIDGLLGIFDNETHIAYNDYHELCDDILYYQKPAGAIIDTPAAAYMNHAHDLFTGGKEGHAPLGSFYEIDQIAATRILADGIGTKEEIAEVLSLYSPQSVLLGDVYGENVIDQAFSKDTPLQLSSVRISVPDHPDIICNKSFRNIEQDLSDIVQSIAKKLNPDETAAITVDTMTSKGDSMRQHCNLTYVDAYKVPQDCLLAFQAAYPDLYRYDKAWLEKQKARNKRLDQCAKLSKKSTNHNADIIYANVYMKELKKFHQNVQDGYRNLRDWSAESIGNERDTNRKGVEAVLLNGYSAKKTVQMLEKLSPYHAPTYYSPRYSNAKTVIDDILQNPEFKKKMEKQSAR